MVVQTTVAELTLIHITLVILEAESPWSGELVNPDQSELLPPFWDGWSTKSARVAARARRPISVGVGGSATRSSRRIRRSRHSSEKNSVAIVDGAPAPSM